MTVELRQVRRATQAGSNSAVPDHSAAPFPIPVVGLAWHVDAACRRLVADGALPAHTWDAHVDGERRVDRPARLADAADACAACPVAQACLDEHLAGTGGGVRAGYVFDDEADYHRHQVDRELAEARRQHPGANRQAAECGTARGARAHQYRGQVVCDPCKAAERAERAVRARTYRREAAERRRQAREQAREREGVPA
jgi:hypothetical protein